MMLSDDGWMAQERWGICWMEMGRFMSDPLYYELGGEVYDALVNGCIDLSPQDLAWWSFYLDLGYLIDIISDEERYSVILP